jgi:hypothetical protein
MRGFVSPFHALGARSRLIAPAFAAVLLGCAHSQTPSPCADPSLRIEERRERSVTEDPAVMGDVPTGMVRNGPPATGSVQVDPLEENELDEFAKRFEKSRAPKILETELAPGASGSVDLALLGASGLSASTEWVGTATALKAVIAVNGTPIATGSAYRIGPRSGGSLFDADAPGGGHASLTVTNTSSVKVQVRLLLVATAR